MILADTNDLIEIVLGSAVTTNEWQYNAFYADITTTTFIPASGNGLSNGTTPVAIVGSPAASTQRQVKYISLYNNDTIANTITVRFDDGTNERILVKILVQPGESLNYINGQGWRVIDPYGIRKEGSILSLPKPAVFQNAGFNAANITGVRTLTSTSSFAQYLCRAEFAYTSCDIRYRVTTAAVTVTWAEIGIGSGSFVIGGNQALTTRGYTDIAGSITSTGIKQTTVSLSGITTGMDLYVIVGNSASTPAALRAGLADNITTGFASSATARPSTMGAATSFTLAADTDNMIWFAVQFS